MKEQLISLETAKLLKDKGFDEKYNYAYIKGKSKPQELVGDYNATYYKKLFKQNPTHFELKEVFIAVPQSLAQKWLREVHNIHISVICSVLRDKYWNEIYGQNITAMESVLEYNTYEEALENAIIEALKLIK